MTLQIAKVTFPIWISVNQYSCVLPIFIWISKEISSIISESKFLIISFKPDPSSSSSFYSKATQSFTLLRLKFMESSLTSLILLCYPQWYTVDFPPIEMNLYLTTMNWPYLITSITPPWLWFQSYDLFWPLLWISLFRGILQPWPSIDIFYCCCCLFCF